MEWPHPHGLSRIGVALLMVFAAVAGVGASLYKNGFLTLDETLDISFSLDCRQLDGQIGQRVPYFPWQDSSTDQENDNHIYHNMKMLRAGSYLVSVRLAFNHGVADEASSYATIRMHI